MRYEVVHATAYNYSEPVFLNTHEIRLRPRVDGALRLHRHGLEIHPEPAGMAEGLDLEGNVFTQVWFKDTTDSFRIVNSFEAETLRSNPFNFLADACAAMLPLSYPEADRERVAPYLLSSRPQQQVAHLAQTAFDQAGGQTLPFLNAINTLVHRRCSQIVREVGTPLRPEATLDLGQGSCRDLAVLFMECCRIFGVAARFVSGYEAGHPDQDDRYLHAWVEVYLPGGGWRGYDPSQGLAVTDRHIPVAAAGQPIHATPITGSFQGNATWDMEVRIDMNTK